MTDTAGDQNFDFTFQNISYSLRINIFSFISSLWKRLIVFHSTICCSRSCGTLISLLHISVPKIKHNPTCVSLPPYGRFSNSCQLQRTGISERRGRVPGGRSFSQTRICRHHQCTRLAKNKKRLCQRCWVSLYPVVHHCVCTLGLLIQFLLTKRCCM